MQKIVCVTFNPALDLSASLAQINLGQLNLVEHADLRAAGKGINVAKVLCGLGTKVSVTGFMGRDNTNLFDQLFESHCINNSFVLVDGPTRTNVKLLESDGRVSEINFPGMQVSSSDVAKLGQHLLSLAMTHDIFVIAGSLAPGLSPQQLSEWIQALGNLGKQVIFDSSGKALEIGLQAKPWLIKPNHHELAQLMGKNMDSVEQCLHAAKTIVGSGISNVVASMGEHGLIWVNQQQAFHAQPPKMKVVSTVGAGDTLVAGLCWALANNLPMLDALRSATALSAISVGQLGVNLAQKDHLKEIEALIKTSKLA
ncbi:1-phosphofructokinase [Alginatibacterium sediminis]|uniref:Phosphofructokinase n=1 Tax=Alginatibacterium sediminis TaxID=2164068 RepID=A0A420E742_9ALTE|nr:1-phosphofructokinase [Alginatibacterium sediminis]RKF13738.1 1-phosphofructokinase [Alginatibacterium sediminis]